MNMKELVQEIKSGNINPYHDLPTQYDVSKDTVKRRLGDMGLKWDYKSNVLTGELTEEQEQMDVSAVFRKKENAPNKNKRKKAKSEQEHVNASTSEQMQLDVFDRLIQPQALKKKVRVSRSFYIDDDVLAVLDNIKGGNKSDLVNEALRHIFRMKGLL